MKKVKLFCLPYAGGSANIYKRGYWKQDINYFIELIPIELAGRSQRYNDKFYQNIDEATEDILNNIKEHINDTGYAIYGHSMGALLAYELYYKIKRYKYKLPIHLFFSGIEPPHIQEKKDSIVDLPREDFEKKLLELGGTPVEIFQSKELLDFIMPILKADFKLVDEYKYIERKNLIDCDITVFAGEEEPFTIESIYDWKNYTNGKCSIFLFKGGHFFINSQEEILVDRINKQICKSMKGLCST